MKLSFSTRQSMGAFSLTKHSGKFGWKVGFGEKTRNSGYTSLGFPNVPEVTLHLALLTGPQFYRSLINGVISVGAENS